MRRSSFGTSIAPTRCASRLTSGVTAKASAAATMSDSRTLTMKFGSIIMFCSPVSAPRSRPLINLAQRFFRNIGRLLRAALADALQIGLVGQQTLAFFPDGPQQLHDGLADRLLEVAVAAPCKFRLDLGERPPGRSGVDGHQVRNALLVLRVIAHLGLTVRDGALEQAHDILRLIHQEHAGPRGWICSSWCPAGSGSSPARPSWGCRARAP